MFPNESLDKKLNTKTKRRGTPTNRPIHTTMGTARILRFNVCMLYPSFYPGLFERKQYCPMVFPYDKDRVSFAAFTFGFLIFNNGNRLFIDFKFDTNLRSCIMD